jgi:hypothetical protein
MRFACRSKRERVLYMSPALPESAVLACQECWENEQPEDIPNHAQKRY